MTKACDNLSVLNKFDRYLADGNIAGAADLISEDFVWHFFNSQLPQLQGDYAGLAGLQTFFETLAALTEETFQDTPVSSMPIGDELVVTHVRDRMTLEAQPVELDAVVVWRIVNGQIAEAWDIPAIHTIRPQIRQSADALVDCESA